LPVGNLTNIIVRDGGYRGAILLMTGMKKISYEYTPEVGYLISAQAGAALVKVVNMSVSNELTGLEFCAGIPGTVGGALWMNAGAYGKEMKDVIKAIYLLDPEEGIKTMKREEISFSYRRTLLPPDTIILGAQFKLKKANARRLRKRENIVLKMDHITMQFGGLTAVDDFDNVVYEGEILGIIGPNGAGKTTAFNVITGIYYPTKGRVIFDGIDITPYRPHQVTHLGIARTFQNIRLFANLTVLDNVLVAQHHLLSGNDADALLKKNGKEKKVRGHLWFGGL